MRAHTFKGRNYLKISCHVDSYQVIQEVMADSSSIDPADSLLINGFLANRESFAQKMEEIYEKVR